MKTEIEIREKLNNMILHNTVDDHVSAAELAIEAILRWVLDEYHD